MDWSGLTSNLVSEAIGILVSVLIIDRLLSWRETKRWLKVRELFFTFADHEATRITRAWLVWLNHLESAGSNVELTEQDECALQELQILCGKSDVSALKRDAQEAVERRFRPPETREKKGQRYRDWEAVRYICGKEFSDDHACWKQLQQELSPPIGKLSDLVDRFSTMVDPEMALAVIRLSMDAENFQSGLYMDQQQRTPLMKAAFATMVVNGIRESISLKEFIRTERLKLDLRLRRKDLSKTWQNEKLEALQSPNLDS